MSNLRKYAPEYQDRPRISTVGNPYGLRGAHYGTRGNILSGTTAEGARIGSGGAQPIGYARRQSDIERQRLAEQQQLASQAATPLPTITPDNLAARKKLFQDMQKAGFNNLTPAMRDTAVNKLGISHEAFNNAADSIRVNEFYTPHPSSRGVNPSASTAAPKPKPVAASNNLRQAMPDPAGLTPQIATNTPGEAPLVNGQRINRLTGKPMGWLPGDPTPEQAATAPAAPVTPSYVPPALQSSYFPQTTPPAPINAPSRSALIPPAPPAPAPVTPTTPAATATANANSALRATAPSPPDNPNILMPIGESKNRSVLKAAMPTPDLLQQANIRAALKLQEPAAATPVAKPTPPAPPNPPVQTPKGLLDSNQKPVLDTSKSAILSDGEFEETKAVKRAAKAVKDTSVAMAGRAWRSFTDPPGVSNY